MTTPIDRAALRAAAERQRGLVGIADVLALLDALDAAEARAESERMRADMHAAQAADLAERLGLVAELPTDEATAEVEQRTIARLRRERDEANARLDAAERDAREMRESLRAVGALAKRARLAERERDDLIGLRGFWSEHLEHARAIEARLAATTERADVLTRERDEARADLLRFGGHAAYPGPSGPNVCSRTVGPALPCRCGWEEARARAEGRTG